MYFVGLAFVGTYLSTWFGSTAPLTVALGVAMLSDYVLGVATAILAKSPHTEEGKLSSKVMHQGLMRKVGTCIALAFVYTLDKSLGATLFPICVSAFFVQEGLSLLENLQHIGVPLPAIVRQTLEQHK